MRQTLSEVGTTRLERLSESTVLSSRRRRMIRHPMKFITTRKRTMLHTTYSAKHRSKDRPPTTPPLSLASITCILKDTSETHTRGGRTAKKAHGELISPRIQITSETRVPTDSSRLGENALMGLSLLQGVVQAGDGHKSRAARKHDSGAFKDKNRT